MHRKGTAKLNTLRDIEIEKQAQWEHEKLFQSTVDENKEKHFVTFPYPYMNGTLHLGHAFTLSKCEFSMGYERMKGKNTMWGFGLHCTGMPIKSSADKLCREMKEFGYPPVFPRQQEKEKEEKKECGADKSKGKKSKATSKSGGLKYQWEIMRNNGMTDEEIVKFIDPMFWLEYYPPMTVEHMKLLGIKVDWRRSFITTDANPFYDSFVRWQFNKLRKANKIMFGKRETVFSPRDGQPCMDHDRATGEGVGPQEYTLIKMVLQKPYPDCLKNMEDKFPVSLVAATLRPETMYGQTNCWIHPDLNYVAVSSQSHGVLVCVERAARNMAYQEILSDEQGKMDILVRMKGSELLGSAVSAPLSHYKTVYVLPMLTVKENKGTGIVTSVPSDSPDDFAALRDLKKKPAMREKYGIRDDMVAAFEPVPIIATEKLGDMCAPRCVEEMGIVSQNDTEKLERAKEECYRCGFYEGRLLVGEFAGQEVQAVKERVQAGLLAGGLAVRYSEPERQVLSRSGDECVVARCDQWYLDYSEAGWKAEARRCLGAVDTCGKEVRHGLEASVERLHEYACSRSYGLGTRLPWDPQYLVESLSDSTVYMAYYTVAHLLQGGTLDGHCEAGGNAAGLSAQEMSEECWEYVLGDSGSREAGGLEEGLRRKLEVLRREFLYWYPVDLRVSGKDLVPNHLTFYLYGHCALWPRDSRLWPRKIRANGHLLLNNEKMAKSTGNFMTVLEAVAKYGADGMRLALADSGDTIEDANFVEDMADAGVLRLYTFLEWARETVAALEGGGAGVRRGAAGWLHCDSVFRAATDRAVEESDCAYRDMLYRRAVQTGLYELQAARDRYREVSLGNCHAGLLLRFIEVQCLLLSPLCPHLCDYIWRDVLRKPSSILHESWPLLSQPVDTTIVSEGAFIDKIAAEFRRLANQKPRFKTVGPPANGGVIWVATRLPRWQQEILDTMVSMATVGGRLPDNRELNKELGKSKEVSKRMKKAMDYVQSIRERTAGDIELLSQLSTAQFDEKAVIEANLGYLERTLGFKMGRLEVRYCDSALCHDEKVLESCSPLEPIIVFSTVPESASMTTVHIVNPQLHVGLFSLDVSVCDGDSVSTVQRRIAEQAAIRDFSNIILYRTVEDGRESIPNCQKIFDNLEKIHSSATFSVNEATVQLIFNGAFTSLGDKLKYVYN